MSKITFRRAKYGDAKSIIAVKQATWPTESVNQHALKKYLLYEEYAIVLAIIAEQIVGYLSCFPTAPPDNIFYWEHDQLAVHPEYRRRGIARELIAHGYDMGFVHGNDQHRAWIQIDNIASQRAFWANGFQTDDRPHHLHVCHQHTISTATLSAEAELMPVDTLSYVGYWLMGDVKPSDFGAARHHLQNPQIDLVGMMIPFDRTDLITAAQANAYQPIAHFHRWWRA